MSHAERVGYRPCPTAGGWCRWGRRNAYSGGGSVPVFVDGPGTEGEGQLCENAMRGYHGEQQSWLHSVCAGTARVSARLQAGGTDVKGDWREQLDQNAAPWLAAQQPV